MATESYSEFEISETDLYIFQGWLDFFAAATITSDDTDAKASFIKLAPAFLWTDADVNSISFLSFIYDGLLGTGGADKVDEPTFNLFHGKGCMTDTELAAGEPD